ncbi:D-amino-acid:oxygen oxidoreductase (deaminating) [Micromonospora pisi]|uniref:D-amino-acid oxidase n=1 Tax=Micromonospora pisi TaxID=589240 RepID=A0A495JA05_9ACTN|nr:FAD-dependent oxidoreductase [Micromonospora pisi]RKR85860.1 D-amino-acid:oxygen oxidoreductase (deaminating) [Micromonospora pisi]
MDTDRATGFDGGMVDVVVVGAGVIGLTCAMRLQRAGARVAVVTAQESGRTVSRIAAAVWYPTRTDADPRVLEWSHRTFVEFAEQAGRAVPGVVMRPTRMLLRGAAEPRPWWSPAVPDFRAVAPTDVPPGVTGEWRFTVPTVEMGPYLDWLVEQVVAAGAPMLRRRVARLADVADLAPVVVNATGLASGTLAADPAVHPARGQIVLVENPGLVTSVRDEQNPAGITYVHPRASDVVLGGTFERDAWDTGVDDAAGRAILDRSVALVPELAGARVTGQRVGLRPARHGGARVAVDPVGLPGGRRLVHSYGHGGAGVTLSWGCADEVVRLCGWPVAG